MGIAERHQLLAIAFWLASHTSSSRSKPGSIVRIESSVKKSEKIYLCSRNEAGRYFFYMLLLWYFASIGNSFPKHLEIDFDWPLRSVRIAKEVCGVDLVVSIVLFTSEPTAAEYQESSP